MAPIRIPAITLICTWGVLLCGCSSDRDSEVSAVRCRRGPFRVLIREKGVIGALRETTVESPTSRQIAQMVSEGTTVKEGDILCRLDPAGLEQRVKDRTADLEITKASNARRQASADAAVHYAEQNVESSRLSLELAKKELRNARAGLLTEESEKIMAVSDVEKSEIEVEDGTRRLAISKRLRDAGVEEQSELDARVVEKTIAEVGRRKARVIHEDVMNGLSEDELREYELEVELATFRLASAEKDLKQTKERNDKYLKHGERRIEWAEKALEKAKEEYAETIIRSPGKGVVLIKSTWGGKYAPGMWAFKNREIMALPDLSKMKVDTFVEESMAARIKKGQKALIRAPSAPGKVFEGRVLRVGSLPRDVAHDLDSESKLNVSRPERRVFEVSVVINGQDDRLKPGMNAEVEIVSAEVASAIAVPRNAILREGGKTYVRVLTAAGPEKREIVVAAEDEHMAAVTEGLEEGSEVLLSEG